MPRIPRDSYVKELDLLNPTEILTLLGQLHNQGFNEIGLLLEPCIIETMVKNNVHTIAISSPALILKLESINPDVLNSLGFYRVLKDTWADYVFTDTSTLLSLLRAVLSGESALINNVKILVHGDCPQQGSLYIVEMLLLKYSWRPIVKSVDFKSIESLYKSSFRENKIVLLAHVTNESIAPLVWLNIDDKSRSINTCKPGSRSDPAVIGSLIDAFLYASLMKTTS